MRSSNGVFSIEARGYLAEMHHLVLSAIFIHFLIHSFYET